MKALFKIGDIKEHLYVVQNEDLVFFKDVKVHPFFSTYALTREAEWSSRLFVLEMKEDDEEGIGTHIHIDHLSPVLLGMTVLFKAEIEKLDGNVLICSITVMVGERLIAKGLTGQKIIKKDKLDRIYQELLGTT